VFKNKELQRGEEAQLVEQSMKEIRLILIFVKYDPDASGTIPVQDLEKILKIVMPERSTEELNVLVGSVAEGSVVDYKDFLKWLFH